MKKFFLFLLMLSLGLTSSFTYAQSTNDYDSSNTAQQPEATQLQPEATQQQPEATQQQPEAMQTDATAQTVTNHSIYDTKMAMRKLWEDHIVWTRNFIISAIAGLKDLEAVTKRLLRNQDDIGSAIKPYYGDDAGNKLAKLLREHILIAEKVVTAAKSNNKAALDKAQNEWTKNADEIATFLSSANPNLDKKDLLNALQMHLDLTTQEASARLHKNWQDDIKAYDENHDHMLMFSDALVDGIAKQFPEKFSS